MGLFRRAASAVNQADPVASAVITLSPSIRRVDKLLVRGTRANGVITGIRFALNDSTVRKEFAVAVETANGWHRIGVRTQPVAAHRLRLGVPVVVKLDGDRGALDWDAMTEAWGLHGSSLSQDSLRRPPDDGVVDTALDARVQRRLKKLTRTDATIVSLTRRTVFGLASQNWDIVLRLPDGGTAVSKGDEVPSYAQWDAAPGATVPAVIDPNDPARAAIDWPTFAARRFESAGFDDVPPDGSIAAEIEAAADAGAATVMSASARPDPAPDGRPVTLDQTLQAWVDAVRGGHMKHAEFERSLSDWQTAGMCTSEQSEAARAAVAA